MNMILPILVIVSIFGLGCRCEVQPLKSKCDTCYLKHYEVKECIPVFENGSDCPARYNCPKKAFGNPSVCVYKGKSYKEGEAIDIGNPCQECRCEADDFRGGVDIECDSIECPSELGDSLEENCYWAHKEGQCCAEQRCPTDAAAPTKVCEYRGKTYRYGEEIYGDSATCICNEKWTGMDGNSCTKKPSVCSSMYEDRKKYEDGCIPVYYENSCCSIDSVCGGKHGYKNTTTVSLAKKEDIDSGNTCIFDDVHYKIGQTLDLVPRERCVTCSCVTPPDFTCIHRKCPEPPTKGNCKAKYSREECCATYTCVL